jgi:3-dehydroquinate dehydratase II
MKKKVLIIHGPNLNMLGIREPETYGSFSLTDINQEIKESGEKLNLELDFFQSNHEGDIVEKIQSVRGTCNGLIINPAAYTHTSIAIRDAISLLDIPVIEIHMSNIYKRESFRRKSLIAGVVAGQIAGFGKHGYLLALYAMKDLVK